MTVKENKYQKPMTKSSRQAYHSQRELQVVELQWNVAGGMDLRGQNERQSLSSF